MKLDHAQLLETLESFCESSGSRYALVLVAPGSEPQVHSSSSMSSFVGKFLPQSPITSFLAASPDIESNPLTKLLTVGTTGRTLQLDASDDGLVCNHLERCFNELQQLACKSLSKQWIRAIEPRKQTHFPYKGGDRTKPSWWPSDVRHKEPDHLMKSERVALMLAVILNNRIPIGKLRRATMDAKNEMDDIKVGVLEEVYLVGEHARLCKYDKEASPLIMVTDFSLKKAQKIESIPIDRQYTSSSTCSSMSAASSASSASCSPPAYIDMNPSSYFPPADSRAQYNSYQIHHANIARPSSAPRVFADPLEAPHQPLPPLTVPAHQYQQQQQQLLPHSETPVSSQHSTYQQYFQYYQQPLNGPPSSNYRTPPSRDKIETPSRRGSAPGSAGTHVQHLMDSPSTRLPAPTPSYYWRYQTNNLLPYSTIAPFPPPPPPPLASWSGHSGSASSLSNANNSSQAPSILAPRAVAAANTSTPTTATPRAAAAQAAQGAAPSMTIPSFKALLSSPQT